MSFGFKNSYILLQWIKWCMPSQPTKKKKKAHLEPVNAILFGKKDLCKYN